MQLATGSSPLASYTSNSILSLLTNQLLMHKTNNTRQKKNGNCSVLDNNFSLCQKNKEQKEANNSEKQKAYN